MFVWPVRLDSRTLNGSIANRGQKRAKKSAVVMLFEPYMGQAVTWKLIQYA